MYNFYCKTTKDNVLYDKYIFEKTKEYNKTIENIKLHLRTNKLEKIINMINEIKPSN